jgi:hypothetical protein
MTRIFTKTLHKISFQTEISKDGTASYTLLSFTNVSRNRVLWHVLFVELIESCLRYVGSHSPSDTSSHHGRTESSVIPLWENLNCKLYSHTSSRLRRWYCAAAICLSPLRLLINWPIFKEFSTKFMSLATTVMSHLWCCCDSKSNMADARS